MVNNWQTLQLWLNGVPVSDRWVINNATITNNYTCSEFIHEFLFMKNSAWKKKEKEEWNMRIAGAKTMNKLQENQATYPEYISMIEI